jgi:AcrR family transcriptional regulator
MLEKRHMLLTERREPATGRIVRMDPRIARTRRSLQEALFELARERPLDDITVGDIAERAEVNRSSFYQHYADKETLLADALDAAADQAEASLPEPVDMAAAPPPAVATYFAHIADNADLYRRVLGDHGSAVATARLRQRVERIVVDEVGRSDGVDFADLPLDVVAAGITGSVLGIIRAWLSREPLPSPATAAAWVWGVILGPVAAERARSERQKAV